MGNSRFYSALAALLFAAVCAYTAAALFETPEKIRSLPDPPTSPVPVGAELCRRELIMLGAGGYCAAFLPDASEAEIRSCRLSFEGSSESFPAEIVFSSRRAAVFHITNYEHSLPRGFFRAELIY